MLQLRWRLTPHLTVLAIRNFDLYLRHTVAGPLCTPISPDQLFRRRHLVAFVTTLEILLNRLYVVR